MKDLKGDDLLWGDEIEYGVFHVDPESKKIRLSLRAKEVSIVSLVYELLYEIISVGKYLNKGPMFFYIYFLIADHG